MKNTSPYFFPLLLLLFFSCYTPRIPVSQLDYYEAFPADQYNNIVFIKGRYCGLKNTMGKVIIPSNKYIYIRPLANDNSCDPYPLYVAETLNSVVLFDGEGKVILPSEDRIYNECSDGKIIATSSNKAKIVDVKGNEIIPPVYESLRFTKGDLIIAGKNDKKGLINLENEVVIPFQYDFLRVVNKDSIYAFTGSIDSIGLGSPESYEKVAYFFGELNTDVEKVVPTEKDQMPRFPGCEDISKTDKEKKECAEKLMLEYIYKKIKYPRQALIHNIGGMVIVSFVVEKDGSISKTKLLRDVRGGCGVESLRIIESMPPWIPGIIDGEPAKVQFNLPIRFKLSG